MRMILKLLVAGAVLVCAGAAGAEGQVALGRSGMTYVWVWRDADAYSEAIKLIRANVHKTKPEMVMQLLSCVADPGDHAVVLDHNWGSATVVLVDGDNSGCRGVVAVEDVR